MLIQAVPGRKVRDPALNDVLPQEGRDVPVTHYWLRRLRDGDVIAVKSAPALKRADRRNEA